MKNKTVAFLITSWLSIGSLFAQESPQTLFGNKFSFSNLGIMASPGFQWTRVAGQNVGLAYFKAGIVINDKFTLGGFYAEPLDEDHSESFSSSGSNKSYLDFYQAGGFMEFTVLSSKVVHLTFPLSIGGMEMDFDEEDGGFDYDYEETMTFFAEPGVQVEINLHRFARLHGGIGYRFMSDVYEGFPDMPEAGNSLTLNLGLKIGLFSLNHLKTKD